MKDLQELVGGGGEGLVVEDHLVVEVSDDHLPDSHLSVTQANMQHCNKIHNIA